MIDPILTKFDVLVVDDDEAVRDSLSSFLGSVGIQVRTASTPEEALGIARNEGVQVVISDVRMPGMDGITLLGKLHEISPDIEVLIVTGHSNEQLAIDALRAGAFDYFRKPLNAREIVESLRKTRQFQLLRAENRNLKALIERTQETAGAPVFGSAPASQELLARLQRAAAATETTVLLCGETGTGKEVAARFLHQHSRPSDAPFVAVNCGAFPEQLLEAELFGHEKGAFTGADKQKPGIFEMAQGGTVFLDEVSEMSLGAQSRFLRILEERKFRRVGGTREVEISGVRVIAATNRDLKQYVEEKKFREDLYWRLSVARIELPPLRERRQDIAPLARRFLDELSTRFRRKLSLAKAAERALAAYRFPGNIRELRNLLEHAAVFASNSDITPRDLGIPPAPGDAPDLPEVPLVPMPAVAPSPAAAPVSGKANAPSIGDNLDLDQMELNLVKEALRRHPGNHTRAAKALGITPQALYRKLEKFGMKKPSGD